VRWFVCFRFLVLTLDWRGRASFRLPGLAGAESKAALAQLLRPVQPSANLRVKLPAPGRVCGGCMMATAAQPAQAPDRPVRLPARPPALVGVARTPPAKGCPRWRRRSWTPVSGRAGPPPTTIVVVVGWQPGRGFGGSLECQRERWRGTFGSLVDPREMKGMRPLGFARRSASEGRLKTTGMALVRVRAPAFGLTGWWRGVSPVRGCSGPACARAGFRR
jgi:hypothetical protein